jgi:GAF domain-containing protein
MIAETRQWLKSYVGELPVEIPRGTSFCNHVITEAAAVVVQDATADPRFSCNPLVTANPRTRFYAGVAIKGPDAQLVGALCIIDVVPRTLDQTQLSVLKQIGEDVSELLRVYPALREPRVDSLEQATST